MADLLSIGSNAAQIYRIALTTVSNNIANINNEAYSRQQTMLSSGVPARVGVLNVGTGANIDYIYRSYNAFVEGSLRESTSSLNTQSPLINYTDRIINIMASDDGNLVSAMDEFFSALNQLEIEPANIGMRNEVLAASNSLSSRIRSLASELQGVKEESQKELDNEIELVNKAANALYNVNYLLNRNSSLQQQSASLLDQRDSLLRELSQYANIDVTENSNGTVVVRLSGPANQATLVDTQRARLISVKKDPIYNSIKGLEIDTYYNPVFVGIPQDGSIAGLIQLNNEVTEPLASGLNDFVRAFVAEINQQHRQGLDLKNELGEDFFQIRPNFAVTDRSGQVLDVFSLHAIPGTELGRTEIVNLGDGLWSARSLGTNQLNVLRENTDENGRFLEIGGIQIALLSTYTIGATYTLQRQSQLAEDIVVAIDDPTRIAAASRLHIDQHIDNSAKNNVSIDYSPPEKSSPVFPGYSVANQQQRNLTNLFSLNPAEPQIIVPPGFGDFSISFTGSLSEPVDLQILNSKFLRLLGTSPAETDWVNNLKNSRIYGTNRFVDVSESSYPDADLFVGVRATNSLISNPVFEQANGASIDEGALYLNGHLLRSLDLPEGGANHPAVISEWINSQTQTGVTAKPVNIIRVNPSSLDFKKSLTINGEAVRSSLDSDELIANINSLYKSTGVLAGWDMMGNLTLTNVSAEAGKNIVLGQLDGSSNSLGISSGIYTGTVEYKSNGNIDFSLGHTGSSIDLAVLGFQTTLYGSNAGNESLHIYLDGPDDSISLQISADTFLPPTARSIEPDVKIEFFDDAGTLYCRLTDTASACIMEESEFSSDNGIDYHGVNIMFDRMPADGDDFMVTTNYGALGDNSNLRRVSAVENVQILQGQTIRSFYVNEVDKVGASSELAKMNEIAADILYEENTRKRSGISGVNLDQEAADLLRFQQAFQAAAQLIQTANTLFDTIVNAA